MKRNFKRLKKNLRKRRQEGTFFQQGNNDKWYLKGDEILNKACENTTFIFHQNN